jgi:hypothetical protein
MLKNPIVRIALLLLIFNHCSTPIKPIAQPTEGHSFFSLSGNIFFRNDQFKFSGKILLSFDQKRDKILLLSPMNQVYFKLMVKNEGAVLVNLKKRRYWTGSFHVLFSRMGQVDLTYRELHTLILKGTIPASSRHYAVTIKDRHKDGRPRRIVIEGHHLLVRFKLRSLKKRKGEIHFQINKSRLTYTDLETTLSLD